MKRREESTGNINFIQLLIILNKYNIYVKYLKFGKYNTFKRFIKYLKNYLLLNCENNMG